MIEQYIGTALEQAPALAAVLTAYWAGAATPFGYIMERMRGFGRASVSQLPYQAPPGLKKEQALRRATSAIDAGPPIQSQDQSGAESGESTANGSGDA